ncbi:MAG: hypothetical protein QMC83_08460 [Thermodesulfovibrionales bacterium]|nr:hypothetical protein [Thermodesulfovibrionales bacterium]
MLLYHNLSHDRIAKDKKPLIKIFSGRRDERGIKGHFRKEVCKEPDVKWI